MVDIFKMFEIFKMVVDTISAHYFCLLFSSGLGQRRVKGFLVEDIRREVGWGFRLKCVYCHKKRATVGCAEPKCKKCYHQNCGKKHNSLFRLTGQARCSKVDFIVYILISSIRQSIYSNLVLKFLSYNFLQGTILLDKVIFTY